MICRCTYSMCCGVIILILSNKSMSVPRSHLLAYGQQLKHQNHLWNLLKVNNFVYRLSIYLGRKLFELAKRLLSFYFNLRWKKLSLNITKHVEKKAVFLNKIRLTLYVQKQPPEVFCEKGVLRYSADFAEKHLCWSLFNKIPRLQVCNSIKNKLQHRCFPVKFEKILKHQFWRRPTNYCSVWLFVMLTFSLVRVSRFLSQTQSLTMVTWMTMKLSGMKTAPQYGTHNHQILKTCFWARCHRHQDHHRFPY